MRLCNDRDLYKWEPGLFVGSASERVISRGSGAVISGTDFIAAAYDFLFSGVEAGGIIRVWNELAQVDFCCEIISVGENGHLTISAIRPDDVDLLWTPGNYSTLDFAVVSYSPVIEEVSYCLINSLRIADRAELLIDNRRLKLACVYAVLAGCYASIAISGDDKSDELYWSKSHYYRKLFDEYRSGLELEFDLDGDGDADQKLSGAYINLERK